MTQTMNIKRLEMETTDIRHLTCHTDDMKYKSSIVKHRTQNSEFRTQNSEFYLT